MYSAYCSCINFTYDHAIAGARSQFGDACRRCFTSELGVMMAHAEHVVLADLLGSLPALIGSSCTHVRVQSS